MATDTTFRGEGGPLVPIRAEVEPPNFCTLNGKPLKMKEYKL